MTTPGLRELSAPIPTDPLELALAAVAAREELDRHPDSRVAADRLALVEMAAGGAVYRLNPTQVEQMQRTVYRLNRRAERLGVRPVTFSTLATRTEITAGRGGRPGTAREFVYVAAGAESVSLNGHRLAAVLEWDKDARKTLIKAVPGGPAFDARPWRDHPPDCEHCNVNRRRNNTYLVVDEDDGVRQVGSSCLADYTGHASPEALARWASVLAEFDATLRSGGEGGDDEQSLMPTDEYLAAVAAEIRRNGWRSRGSVYEHGGTASADAATADYWDRVHGSRQTQHPPAPPRVEDVQLAADALVWARGLNEQAIGDSDYLHNLSVATSPEAISHERTGLVGSTIVAYQRAHDQAVTRRRRDAERAALIASSTHQGTPGEKLTGLEVRVHRVGRGVSNQWGTSYPVDLVDDAGNAYQWWAKDDDIAEGSRIRVKSATVKAHGAYQGLAQTELSHIRRTSIEVLDGPEPPTAP